MCVTSCCVSLFRYLWEVVVLLRKVLALCIGVFQQQAFVQSFCATLLLVISLCAQLVVEPYVEP